LEGVWIGVFMTYWGIFFAFLVSQFEKELGVFIEQKTKKIIVNVVLRARKILDSSVTSPINAVDM
jgi:hypothetical protein